jgi:DNA processing protein
MERAELSAWLTLLETPGVGRETARRLLSAFGSPEAVIAASATTRAEIAGARAGSALGAPSEPLMSLVDRAMAWQSEAPEGTRAIVVIGDPRYPNALLNTADPPLLLYAQGRLELLQAERQIAIVGSRNPTPQGEQSGRAFASSLGQAGWVIVSGLALGVDTAAHEGALASGCATIAVVGTGLDRVYPKRNLELAHRIAREGLLLSEFALGTPPLAANFPLRNRLIAGMTQGTLVVEAALQSGSLITARLASEAGREVFAIPGSIHSPQSRGCHALIRQGAKLVESAEDVLDELMPLASARPRQPEAALAAGLADPLLQAMGHDLVSLDVLAVRTGWSVPDLTIRLLDLELDGQVAKRPGQLFQRIDGS